MKKTDLVVQETRDSETDQPPLEERLSDGAMVERFVDDKGNPCICVTLPKRRQRELISVY